MINYSWKILEIFSKNNLLISVKYLLSATDQTTIESEGNHTFSEGIVNKPLDQIVESDIVQWLEKDTTKNDVNVIKLNLENQLKALESNKKVDFPWLADTFTPN